MPRLLALALATALLSACSGAEPGETSPPIVPSKPDKPAPPPTDGETPEPGEDPEPAPEPEPDPTNPFPQPTSAKYDEIDVGGFYDIDATGKTRAVRNDLDGDLPAMVQFAQSHTVDPSGNEEKNMPRLTSERAALLLVTPDPSLGEIESLQLVASVDGVAKSAVAMLHPNEMYRSDSNNSDGRPDYNYSRRAWSVHLPWDWVKPGLSLTVTDTSGRTGTLAADKIDFAAPAELVVQSIRLGMLTDPPAENDNHWMLRAPARAAADYFQTIPAARMTVGYYEPVRLDRVMVASGVIYDTASAGEGGVYSGDMRENTGKSTVSVGVNLANFGATSSGMQSQSQPQLFQHVLAHHNVGNYSNGVQSHGLSGGNGMLTVYATRGNEFSHEIGHHYGLGHYPGAKDGNNFWAGHHHDSGWGYIAYRKRMRGNLNWSKSDTTAMAGMPDYAGIYAFGTDAMSGGHYSSSLSKYTHYTGYSTKIAIQPRLDRVIPSAESSTGYLKWNADSRRMEEVSPDLPGGHSQWFFNTADGKYPKPRLVGAPVFTILGGYDPDTGRGLLYPAFRGNWGNVFDLPAPADDATARQCWLDVSFVGKPNRKIALFGNKPQSGSVNKLHVNLAQADAPSAAKLMCQDAGAAAVQLHAITIPQGLPPMPAPVVIGKEAGYIALRKIELPELEAALLAQANADPIRLGSHAQVLYASYADDPTGLSSDARAVFDRYARQLSDGQRVNRWMTAYRTQLQSGDAAAHTALFGFLDTLDLRVDPLVPAPQQMLVRGHCLKVETVEGQLVPYISADSTCTGANDELWIADARGVIRSATDPSMCLSSRGGHSAVTLVTCDANKGSQLADLSGLPAIKLNGTCLDLSGGKMTDNRGSLITYGCTGSANQQWAGITPNDNRLFALLSNHNLQVLVDLADE